MKKLLFLMLLTTFGLTTKASDIYSVASERVNVRTSPSAKSKIIGYILYGENVQVIDSANGVWYKIKVTNLTGYVNGTLLRKVVLVDQEAKTWWYNFKIFSITTLFILLAIGVYCLFKVPSKEENAFIPDNSIYSQNIIIKERVLGLQYYLRFSLGHLECFIQPLKAQL